MPLHILPTPPPPSSGDLPESVDQSQFTPLQLAGQGLVDNSMEGLRGLISSIMPFVNTPPTTAGRVGEALGTGAQIATPLIGKVINSGPALEELLRLLEGPIDEKDAASLFMNERIGGVAPKPTKLKVPKEVETPIENVPRDPAVAAARDRELSFNARTSTPKPQVQRVTAPTELPDITQPVGTMKEPPPLIRQQGSGEQQYSRGNAGNRYKLNPDGVREIRKLLDKKVDPLDIAKQYGLSPNTIRAIQAGDSWAWVK